MKTAHTRHISASALLLAALWSSGCDKSTEPAQTSGELSMTAKYTTSGTALLKSSGISPESTAEVAAVDSIRITKARFVLRDIKFKTAGEDSASFKATPIVLTLNLSETPQTIAVVPMKFGTYRRMEFDVHRVEQSIISNLPAADQAQFADFLAGERYSIIVEGVVYRNASATGTTFIYRSKVDAKQKIDLNPELVITEGSTTVNATILISSAQWFRAQNGSLVDPTVSQSEGVIDENLKSSIRVFKDNNKDGSKD
ncbi:MAG TPA: hypothetical protein DEP53_06680 [Bacteroidetes bacterium]|nr:hypothetical protein [Bacteroidota bacterium]